MCMRVRFSPLISSACEWMIFMVGRRFCVQCAMQFSIHRKNCIDAICRPNNWMIRCENENLFCHFICTRLAASKSLNERECVSSFADRHVTSKSLALFFGRAVLASKTLLWMTKDCLDFVCAFKTNKDIKWSSENVLHIVIDNAGKSN